jgi:hypothetical protein
MMNLMIRFLFLLSFSGALVWSQGLSAVHKVYLLPMSKGLDQYLANRLISEHVLEVVTDPKLADAVFTDRIGDSFETQWSGLVRPAETQKAAKASKDNIGKEEAETEKSTEEKPADEKAPKTSEGNPDARRPASSLLDEPVNQLPDLSRNSGFGRAKGTVFLVNPKLHQVVWSVYQPSKNSSSSQLDRTASDIVSRLKRDLKAQE